MQVVAGLGPPLVTPFTCTHHVHFPQTYTLPLSSECYLSHSTLLVQAGPLEWPPGDPQLLACDSPEWGQIGLLCGRLSVSFYFLGSPRSARRDSLMKAFVVCRSSYLMRPQQRSTPKITKRSCLTIQPVSASYQSRTTLRRALEMLSLSNCRL